MKRCKDCGVKTSNDYLCDECERVAIAYRVDRQAEGGEVERFGRQGTAETFPLERAS